MLLYDPDNVNLLVLIDLYLTIQGLSSAFFPFSAILLRLLFGFALPICQICQDNARTWRIGRATVRMRNLTWLPGRVCLVTCCVSGVSPGRQRSRSLVTQAPTEGHQLGEGCRQVEGFANRCRQINLLVQYFLTNISEWCGVILWFWKTVNSLHGCKVYWFLVIFSINQSLFTNCSNLSIPTMFWIQNDGCFLVKTLLLGQKVVMGHVFDI